MNGRRRFVACGLGSALAGAVGCGLFLRGMTSPDARQRFARMTLRGHVRSGDLVFRAGRSPESLVVLTASALGLYSHVGVAAGSDEGLRIIHAVPRDGRDTGGVVSQPWELFALAAGVADVAAYRVRGAGESERAAIGAAAVRMLGAPFNANFSSRSRDGLYCTQVALLALASLDASVMHHVQARRVALLQEPVYVPDALLAWPRLQRVSQVNRPEGRRASP